MRENETRLVGARWGMFSIFEPSEPRPNRVIDQSVVAWRLASRAAGAAAFENPRSTIQRTVNMITGGSNREYHARLPDDTLQPLSSANERVRFNVSPGAPIPYNREELLRWHNPLIYDPDELARTPLVIHRRHRAIQRRFFSPELQNAMEVAQREYLAWMMHLISEPAPPGYREAIQAAQNAD